ncbi:MAG: hypothetical protein AB7U82_27875 [Blastocatellales bacterium]
MKNRNIGNLLMYFFCVVVVCGAIIYSTAHAFPSSLVIVCLMMLITLGVAGTCTYFAGDAMKHVRVYCTRLNLILGIVGCLNLFGHLAMSRELSSAELGVAEKREEEERQLKLKQDAAQIDIAKNNSEAQVLQAETALSTAERNRLIHLPFSERQSLIKAKPKAAEGQQPASAPLKLEAAEVINAGNPKTAAIMTPAQVRIAWSWWFIIFSFIEAAVSIVGGLGAKMTWAWDRDGNDIDDREEERQRQAYRQPPGMAPPTTTAAHSRSHASGVPGNSNFQ